MKPVTHLLAVDITSKKGINLLHEGIRYLVVFFITTIFLFVHFLYCHLSFILVGNLHHSHWLYFNAHIMMQIEGSKGARLGVLYSSSQDSDLPGLLLVKVFEITTASYRFVSQNYFDSE